MKKNQKRVVEVDTLHGINTILLTKIRESQHPYEYLGADNIPLKETFELYKKKSQDFLSRAKEYHDRNKRLKTIAIHSNIFGYSPSDELTEKVIEERQKENEKYFQSINPGNFDDDPDAMFNNFEEKRKRIRIVRELSENRNFKLSGNLQKEKSTWFTRYCALSKFIQAARMIIVKHRLEKNLAILKDLTPLKIIEYERQLALDWGIPYLEPEEIIPEEIPWIDPRCRPCSEASRPCVDFSKDNEV